MSESTSLPLARSAPFEGETKKKMGEPKISPLAETTTMLQTNVKTDVERKKIEELPQNCSSRRKMAKKMLLYESFFHVVVGELIAAI